jgi:hypothetical protein
MHVHVTLILVQICKVKYDLMWPTQKIENEILLYCEQYTSTPYIVKSEICHFV